ncbi:AAA family ATPase [Nocardioides zeae]
MKLASLTLSGFQCFAPTPTTISFDDVTYLLGPNGSGKTSVLLALARMFAVDQSMRGIRVQDFHVASQRPQMVNPTDVASSASGDAGAAETEATSGGTVVASDSAEASLEDNPVVEVMSELWVEAEFVLPEAHEPEGPDAPAVPEFLFQMRLEDVEGPMRLRIRLTATLDGEDEVEERLEFILSRDSDGKPTKTQPMSGYARRRIQLHYLPARRNPKEQISYAPRSLLGNALRAANWKAENEKIQAWNGEITKSLAANPAIETIGSQLKSNWSQLHKGDHYTSPTISFGQSDLDLLLRQLTVTFGPSPQGSSSSSDMLSDGQQSLLYISTVLAIHEVGRALLANSAPWLSEEKFRPAVFTLLAF